MPLMLKKLEGLKKLNLKFKIEVKLKFKKLELSQSN